MTTPGDITKLGTILSVQCGDMQVVNAYTQYKYGRDTNKTYVDYDAVESAFLHLDKSFPEPMKIGIPKIGAGLSNGNWKIIENIINEIFQNREIYVFCKKLK